MLIDLFATDNYGRYNVKVAEMFNLETAVYLDIVLNIYEKAVRKNKISGGKFVIDRDYIKKRTTLDESEQGKIEESLIRVGVISRTEPCTISIDLPLLANIVGSDDEDIRSGVEKLANIKTKSKRKTKKDVFADMAKKEINTGDAELNSILEQWVDALVAKQGWVNKMIVTEGQSKLIKFASPNLSKAKTVAKIATTNAYRDMEWAINRYKEQNPEEKYLTNSQENVKISTELKF